MNYQQKCFITLGPALSQEEKDKRKSGKDGRQFKVINYYIKESFYFFVNVSGSNDTMTLPIMTIIITLYTGDISYNINESNIKYMF
jgi:hypothetical protein